LLCLLVVFVDWYGVFVGLEGMPVDCQLVGQLLEFATGTAGVSAGAVNVSFENLVTVACGGVLAVLVRMLVLTGLSRMSVRRANMLNQVLVRMLVFGHNVLVGSDNKDVIVPMVGSQGNVGLGLGFRCLTRLVVVRGFRFGSRFRPNGRGTLAALEQGD
jgi:hypothetical protein